MPVLTHVNILLPFHYPEPARVDRSIILHGVSDALLRKPLRYELVNLCNSFKKCRMKAEDGCILALRGNGENKDKLSRVELKKMNGQIFGV